MATTKDCAQLALRVYDVNPNNRVGLPSGWTGDTYPDDPASGFSYGIFENVNEVVISYTGTNEGVDWLANAGNGSGLGSDQLKEAALVAARVIEQYKGSGKTISFTGHSLGGGLASVMAVWFDKQAIVFDEAPFLSAAISPVAYKAAQNYIFEQLGIVTTLHDYTPLDYPSRAGNVTNYYVSGEVLQALRAGGYGIGAQTGIDFGWGLGLGFEKVDPVDLHSQALMTAGWLSPAFREATFEVTNFVPAAFDGGLYSFDPKSDKQDLLRNLIVSEQTSPGAGKLTRIAEDLRSIGQVKDSMSGKALDGVVAQLIEWYYWQDPQSQAQFFRGDPIGTGALQYLTAKGDGFAKAEDKANSWTNKWIDAFFAEQNVPVGLSQAKKAEQWNVVVNESFSWASATEEDKTQFFMGNKGNDELTGGKKDDVLIGGEGDDTLRGMDGDDLLFGGAGSDRLEGGDGFDKYYVDADDTIKDSDGSGSVTLDKMKLGVATRKKGEKEYRDKKGNVFLYDEDNKRLTVNGGLLIKEYSNGDLGIILKEEPDDPIEPIRDGFSQATGIPSPIMLDLDGDGVETTAMGHGAYFDHSADGFAEKTAWVGKDDGLLVRDLNGNGQIDSGRELFGSETLLANGEKVANGFAALAELDGNGDGVIDAQDAAFADLRVWKDANGNGRTDAGELLTLAQAGVQRIDVAYTDSKHVDAQGNAHKQVGSYTTVDGEKRAATDVWVKTDTVYSVPTEWVDVSGEILQLPDAQGYGKVRDLHQAMALDGTGVLKALVAEFTQAATFEARNALVTQIIYHWTGVQDVDPGSRAVSVSYGNPIGDARKLEALEEFMGEEWAGVWCWGTRDPNPHGRAAPVLLKAWDDLKTLVYGQLMAQSHLEGLFQKIDYRWSDEIGSVRGDMSRVATALAAQLGADYEAGLADLEAFLHALRGTRQLDRMDVFSFKAILLPIGAEVSQIFDRALDGNTTIFEPNDRDNVLFGFEYDDLIDGKGGHDRIVGRGGNDMLIGGTGNDTLDGGAGNDELRGGAGADVYLFGRGDGNDIIIEDYSWVRGEADRIEFKAGILPDDVRLERKTGSWPGDDLKITLRDSGETLTVKYHFSSINRYAIEEIIFADGTVWDAEMIKSRTLLGDAGDDELEGFYARNDRIEGGAGNDKLSGLSGDDVLDGGEGNDELHGGSGADTYYFGRGDGHDTIIEDSWSQGEVDRIEFKAGVSPDDVRLERVRTESGWQVSDDLKITVRDTDETLTVKNHFNASNRYAVEEIVFADGTVWDVEMITSRSLLGEAGDDALRGFNKRDDVIEGGAGNDTLIGLSGDDLLEGGEGNDQLYGGSGDDVLIGGAGDDVLEGDAGSDTYRIGLGDGNDVIAEFGTDGEDIVELSAGIAPGDILVRWTLQGDMAVTLPDGSRLTVRGQANSGWNTNGIEQLRFADGTVWDRAELASRALATTTGDDAVVGGYGDDALDGGAGNDHFQNLGGHDTYRFGVGDGQDVIETNGGRVLFKPGIDQNAIVFSREGDDLLATIAGTSDSVRLANWLANHWQNVDRFEFANGAHLSGSDVLAKLNTSEGAEIIYGSPDGETLTGTEKDSQIYGREGDDVLLGGAGSDNLYGEAGNDILDGGADRDWLYGGEGSNTYIVAPGMGLDNAFGAKLAVASDTVQFAAGIRPEDVSIQLDSQRWYGEPGDTGYDALVIGIGGNDALIVRTEDWNDLGRGAIQRFRFDDGTEWTLADVIARADSGKMGWQYRSSGDATHILGSQADDDITDYSGESVTVQARGNDDNIYLAGGDNRVSAGAGNDRVYTGLGNDLIASEAGDDEIESGEGDDTILFNYGDGHDRLRAGEGMDTLSFGASIAPAMLSVLLNREGQVVLQVDGGAGGSITLLDASVDNPAGDLERIQFIDAEGQARIFDLTGWLRAHPVALVNATADAPLTFDGAFELTGAVAPAGGLEAIAYAQSGDLFASANLAHNTPSSGNDVLYGTEAGDTLDAGAGDDIMLGLAGDDTLFGGDGNDLIQGGDGDDVLDGGAGNDTLYGGRGADTLVGGTGQDALYGEWGGDTYLYQAGDGVTIIDDDHRMLGCAYQPQFFAMDVPGGDGSYCAVDDAPNILSFGPGIRPEDLRYSEENGDLVIEFANRPGDKVVLRGYMPGRATQTRSVDVIRFADGTEIVADTIEPTGKTETAGEEGGGLYGTPFADTLVGGDGDDVIYGEGGSDVLVGGAGSDTYNVYKEWGSSPVQTTIVETWRAQDSNRLELTGEVDADALYLAFDGRDLVLHLNEEGDLIRFAGFDPRAPGMQAPVAEISLPWEGVTLSFDDLLARGVRYGDQVQDIYVINIGDGEVFIDDIAAPDAEKILRFGSGIDPETLRANLSFAADGKGDHVLLISYGNAGDVVRLAGFNPDDVLASDHAISRFEFADGTLWDYAALVANGFVVEGNAQPNELTGTNLADRVYGGDGDDVLRGGAGSDQLYGGQGNDLLFGGAGDDAYIFNKGDGIDTIIDSGAVDFNYIRFGADIRPEDIRKEWDGTTLILHYSDKDAVRINDYYASEGNPVILGLAFEDGTVLSLTEQMNRAPVATGSLDEVSVMEGQEFSLTLPADLFSDPDVSDEIRISMRLAGGDPLPTWLRFDPVSGTLSGKPANGDVGNISIVVEGKDHFGAAANTTFNLTVRNTNDTPEVGATVADYQATEDEPFAFTVPQDAFHDIDVGDVLTLSATQADGSALPSWLHFDAATRTFSGTPDNATVGALSLKLTATDSAGAQASQTFGMTVANVNDAPEVGVLLANQSARVGDALNWQMPAGAFTDVDQGDVLTYSATLADGSALPDWLAFDAVTGTFQATPPAAGNYAVQVTATDQAGAQISQTFALNVTTSNSNQAPVTVQDTETVSEDGKWLACGNVLSNDRDPEGRALKVANAGVHQGEYGLLTLLPNGSYTYVLNNLSAKVQALGAGETGVDRFAYVASDGTNRTTGELLVNVQGKNDAPTLKRALQDVQLAKGKSFQWQTPASSFTDRDSQDKLSYTATLANGKALPSWLKFDAVTQTFSGTAPANAKTALDVRMTATDGSGATASDVFKVSFGSKTVLPKAPAGDVDEGCGAGQHAAEKHPAHPGGGGGHDQPGLPGQKAHHSVSDVLADFLQGFKTPQKAGASSASALDAAWFNRWLDQPVGQPLLQSAPQPASGSQLAQTVEQHWQALAEALGQLDADRQGAANWLGKGQGADTGGLAGLLSGAQAWQRSGQSAVGLAASGTQLKGFAGLQEGLGKLPQC